MSRSLTGRVPETEAPLSNQFAEFERDRGPMLGVIERHVEALHRLDGEQPAEVLQAARGEWKRALELGHAYGFRTAQTTLIPPTGTVSLMLDCETTGVEPYYSLGTTKRLKARAAANHRRGPNRLASRITTKQRSRRERECRFGLAA